MKLATIRCRMLDRAMIAAVAVSLTGCSREPERRDYEAVAAQENARRALNESQSMQGCVEAMEGTNLMCE